MTDRPPLTKWPPVKPQWSRLRALLGALGQIGRLGVWYSTERARRVMTARKKKDTP